MRNADYGGYRMYKGASQNSQSRAFRGVYKDTAVAGGHEALLSKKEQAENLKRAIQELDRQINMLPKGSNLRRPLGLQKMKLAKLIEAAKQEKKTATSGPSVNWNLVEKIFRDLVAEQIGEFEARRLYVAAKRKYAADTGIGEEWMNIPKNWNAEAETP